jgi:hypothetical protein
MTFEFTIPFPTLAEITKHDIAIHKWSNNEGPFPSRTDEGLFEVVKLEMHCPLSCPFSQGLSCRMGFSIQGIAGDECPGPKCPPPGKYEATWRDYPEEGKTT